MPALAFDGDRLLLVAGAAYGDLNANALQVRAAVNAVCLPCHCLPEWHRYGWHVFWHGCDTCTELLICSLTLFENMTGHGV
jgi:hypothetical protein